ncbi:hypothetical protein ACO0QE_001904 [Hanseniaspora vineae]
MNLSNSTHPGAIFTCNSCLIQFVSSDMQRYHMKSEWHRYNLHRKINHLPPITSEEFIEKTKLADLAKAQQAEVDENGFELLKPVNDSRKKKYKNQERQSRATHELSEEELSECEKDTYRSLSPAYSTHSKVSGASIDGEFTTDFEEETGSEFGDTSESGFEMTTDDDEDELHKTDTQDFDASADADGDDTYFTDCIFCGSHNHELELNVRHMFNKHGLYIPERTYLVDLEGLLDFLITVVIDEKHCLYCSFQGTTVESVRNHIESKRHAKIPYETTRERALFEEYYDFSLKEQSASPSSTKGSKKTVSFQTGNEEEDSNDDKLSGSTSNDTSEEQKKREKDNYYRKLANEKRERRNTVLAAVPSYDRRMSNGLTQKDIQKSDARVQRLEKMRENRQVNNHNLKRLNTHKHFRDPMLGVL